MPNAAAAAVATTLPLLLLLHHRTEVHSPILAPASPFLRNKNDRAPIVTEDQAGTHARRDPPDLVLDRERT